jgi:deoxyribodipyrimidine photo-lyase
MMMPSRPPTFDCRIHAPSDSRPRGGGEFVLYWMQVTHRAHDNFALNFAVEQANELGLPLQVYHQVRDDYPWASDRFHSWILEAVVDLYQAFAARMISYAFRLEQGSGPRESSALVQMARRAALVVTDFYPTFVVPRQTRDLRRKVETPVVAIDSTTLVPMAYHRKEHSTARGFRTVLLEALPHYLWPVDNPSPRVQRSIDLPFDPVRPAPGSIAALVAGCDIDHSVPPSPIFRGGTTAGRARLAEFLRTGLPRYDEQRDDPNEPDAVSRLSPWLHFGNLSIHEVLLSAREAGPPHQYARFQDEALTWRELSHNFCYFNPKHRTVAGIPEWARAELADHEHDPRPVLYTDEEMEHSRTGDDLWNAAQRSYVRDGWMHNYMRMLWGKAVLQWTPNAAECLRVLEHLNNKYSLDGCDPNSYGGIMWTFGKFDRPFYRRPIYGTVRYQSLRAAGKKFDVTRYAASYGRR